MHFHIVPQLGHTARNLTFILDYREIPETPAKLFRALPHRRTDAAVVQCTGRRSGRGDGQTNGRWYTATSEPGLVWHKPGERVDEMTAGWRGNGARAAGRAGGREEGRDDAASRTGSLVLASRFRPAGMPRHGAARRNGRGWGREGYISRGLALWAPQGLPLPRPVPGARCPVPPSTPPIVARVYTRLIIKPSVCPRSRSNRERDRAYVHTYAYTCVYERESRFLLIVRRPYALTIMRLARLQKSPPPSVRWRRTVSPVFSETFLRVKCNYAVLLLYLTPNMVLGLRDNTVYISQAAGFSNYRI